MQQTRIFIYSDEPIHDSTSDQLIPWTATSSCTTSERLAQEGFTMTFETLETRETVTIEEGHVEMTSVSKADR